MKAYSTGLFNYTKETKTFSAFASDLGRSFCFDPIYKDAADIGIKLVSAKTLEEGTYYLNYIEFDDEGDVVSWELLPTPETVRKHPQLKDTSVLLWND